MSKIMLVEDDNNLREIYQARLLAEGYEIVSAKDGEEALAMAVKEKPDLIIADIMMPKISGFDMLDILRTTPETKNTKVIMMTALSQAEDKERAEKLGADRYLVKSQVTLEDVAKVARNVLEGTAQTATQTPDTNTSASATPDQPGSASQTTPSMIQVNDFPNIANNDSSSSDEASSTSPNLANPLIQSDTSPAVEEPKTSTSASSTINIPVMSDIGLPEGAVTSDNSPDSSATSSDTVQSEVVVPIPPQATTEAEPDSEPKTSEFSSRTRVIQPLSSGSSESIPDIHDLLAKEERGSGVSPPATDTVITPEGNAIVPPVSVGPADLTQQSTSPGSVVHPTNDPNSIAL